jgi:hypothetical protein
MSRYLVLLCLMLVAILTRVIPHPPNFSPVAATAIFGAAIIGRKWAAPIVPLLIMFLSDVLLSIGAHYHLFDGWMAGTYGLNRGSWILYLTFGMISYMGLFLKDERSPLRILGVSLGASLAFFLVSNFKVWLSGSMYTHDLAGFMECYVMAVPFLQWTVLGDLFYSATLFGAWALIDQRFFKPTMALA